jgi:hypothetical protein
MEWVEPMKKKFTSFSVSILMLVSLPTFALAEDDVDLALELSNPVANLISVPFQFNYDSNIGANRDGDRALLNVQPVIPFSLNDDWNVISRTIVPVILQDDIFPSAGDQFGLGDTVQSLFLSPVNIGPSGIIWGAGPVFLVPTGTDDLLSGKKWGAGPTAAVLRQTGGLTVGLLANHIWSFAGSNERPDINATFLQPFITYTTPDAWTFALNTETTYNWTNDSWAVPVNASVSKLLVIDKQPISLGGALRYWVEAPDALPHGFGGRLFLTLLFPKR